MEIIISNSSQVPIYEQIIRQVKAMITAGKLEEGDPLPSVRALAKELQISALTVKKAYDALEGEGLVETVHGKGSFVSGRGKNALIEDARVEAERRMEAAVEAGAAAGMSGGQMEELLKLILEEKKCL